MNIKLNFELLIWRFNFYFSTFKLLTRNWKIKTSVWVTNSKVKVLFIYFYFWVTNSKLKSKKLLWVTSSKSKNENSHFELQSQSWKIKSTCQVINLMIKLLFFQFRVTSLSSNSMGCTFIFLHSSHEHEVDQWKKSLNITV